VSANFAYDYATQRIAVTGDNTYFDRKDWFADVDALNIGLQLRLDSSYLLSGLLKRDYASATSARQRFADFYAFRFDTNPATAQAAAESMFDNMAGGTGTVIRDAFWVDQFGGLTSPSPATVDSGVRTEVARAFKDCLLRFVNS
jgi:hypothetical protein